MVGSEALPFWIDDSLSWRTMVYAGALTLFGSAIVGILPALRVTRVEIQDALRSEGAAGSLRFGGFWTAVIVAQVAITVALLPLAAGGVFESNRFRQRAEGIGAERYLTASVGFDREDHALDSAALEARGRASFDELARRLSQEPDVERVTFADRLPVMDQFKYGIEVDDAAEAAADRPAHEHPGARISRVLRDVRHLGGRRPGLRAARLRDRPRADRERVVRALRVRRSQRDRPARPDRGW
jgi:putative ABC transport system permease protein